MQPLPPVPVPACRVVLALLVLLVALATPGLAGAVNHVVNSTDDDPDNNIGDGVCWTGQLVFFGMIGVNECTLRAAIQESQFFGATDDITFTGLIPLDAFGTVQITPATPLPAITTFTNIDGTTIPEYDDTDPFAFPIVYINGVSSGSGSGLVFSGSGAAGRVEAIGIVNWPSYGVHIAGGQGVELHGCHVGVFKGTLAQGNGNHGVYVSSGLAARIGVNCSQLTGCSQGQPNVISDNGGWGVRLFGTLHLVAGNRIGTDSAGLVDFGNASGGVFVGTDGNDIGDLGTIAPSTEDASGNLISGNGGPGIQLQSADNEVYANWIGVDATGGVALPNDGEGIRVDDTPNTIGNDTVGGNVIAANDFAGIRIEDPVSAGTVDIIGNSIGVDATESVPLGNDEYGIYALDGQGMTIRDNVIGDASLTGISLLQDVDGAVLSGNYIGTNAAGDDLGNAAGGILINSENNVFGDGVLPANVVGHNGGSGVYLWGDFNEVAGNYIGTNAAGDDLGNDQWGIQTTAIHNDNVIGSDVLEPDGNLASRANVVAFNGDSGVGLGDDTLRTAIRGNVFHDNSVLPIDLDRDGATANDPGDPDVGANELQNFPEIDATQTFWNDQTGQIDIRYRVDSLTTESVYPIVADFYVSDASGPGQIFVGSDTISFAEAGAWRTVSFTPAPGLPVLGEDLTSTATDSDGPGSTSEMSAPIPLPEPGLAPGLASGIALLWALRRLSHRRSV